jgi:hypothetical protein
MYALLLVLEICLVYFSIGKITKAVYLYVTDGADMRVPFVITAIIISGIFLYILHISILMNMYKTSFCFIMQIVSLSYSMMLLNMRLFGYPTIYFKTKTKVFLCIITSICYYFIIFILLFNSKPIESVYFKIQNSATLAIILDNLFLTHDKTLTLIIMIQTIIYYCIAMFFDKIEKRKMNNIVNIICNLIAVCYWMFLIFVLNINQVGIIHYIILIALLYFAAAKNINKEIASIIRHATDINWQVNIVNMSIKKAKKMYKKNPYSKQLQYSLKLIADILKKDKQLQNIVLGKTPILKASKVIQSQLEMLCSNDEQELEKKQRKMIVNNVYHRYKDNEV